MCNIVYIESAGIAPVTNNSTIKYKYNADPMEFFLRKS